MKVESSLEILTDIANAWELTQDVEQLPTFTPSIKDVTLLNDGEFGLGSRARLKQPWQPPLEWTVTRFEKPTHFEWATSFLGVSITALHELVPTSRGCRNTLSVTLSGRGSGVFRRLAGGRILWALETENAGFKERLEGAEA